MTLFAVVMTLLVIHLLLYLTSRTTWETLFYLTHQRAFAWRCLEAEGAGAKIIPLLTFQHVRHRFQVAWAYRVVIAMAVAAGWVIAAWTAVPVWIIGLAVAVVVVFHPALVKAAGEFTGRRVKGLSRAKTQNLLTLAGQMIAVGIISAAMTLTYRDVDRLREATAGIVPGVANNASVVGDAAASVALLAVGYAVIRLFERLGRRFATTTGFENQANLETVLYLRSFADDDLAMQSPITDSGLRSWLWPQTSFEEFVSNCTINEGNLITVGRPNEDLPKSGADRAYFDADSWQEAIRLTTQRVSRILLTAGASGALDWEVSQLRAWGVLPKTLFLIPPLGTSAVTARIRRLFDALELPLDDTVLSDDFPIELVVAVAVNLEGVPLWYIAPGRDWLAYLETILSHSQMTTSGFRWAADTPLVGAEELEIAEELEEPSKGTIQPMRAPTAVRRAIRRSWRATLNLARDKPGQAIPRFDAVIEHFRRHDPDPEALAFLLLGLARALSEVEDRDRLVSVISQLEDVSHSLDWIWVDLAEVMDAARVHFELLGALAELHEDRDHQDLAIATHERRVTLAEEALDLRDRSNSRCDLALALTDQPERGLALATQALAEAERIGDTVLRGRCIYVIGTIEQSAGKPAADHLAMAGEIWFGSGENHRAAAAGRDAAAEALSDGDFDHCEHILQRAVQYLPEPDDPDGTRIAQDLAALREEFDRLRALRGMLSPTAQRLMLNAEQLTQRWGERRMGSGHLLLAAVTSPEHTVLEALESQGVDRVRTTSNLLALMIPLAPSADCVSQAFSGALRQVLLKCIRRVQDRGSTRLDVGDLIAELARIPGGFASAALEPHWAEVHSDQADFVACTDRFSASAKEVTVLSGEVARRTESHIAPEHLLAAILDSDDPQAKRLRRVVDPQWQPSQRPPTPAVDRATQRALTTTAKHVCVFAAREALVNDDPEIEVAHLILGLLDQTRGLNDLGVTLTVPSELLREQILTERLTEVAPLSPGAM